MQQLSIKIRENNNLIIIKEKKRNRKSKMRINKYQDAEHWLEHREENEDILQ